MQVAGASAAHTTGLQLARPGGTGCGLVLSISCFDGSCQHVVVFQGLVSLSLFVVLSHGEGRKKSVYNCAASLTVSTFAYLRFGFTVFFKWCGFSTTTHGVRVHYHDREVCSALCMPSILLRFP